MLESKSSFNIVPVPARAVDVSFSLTVIGIPVAFASSKSSFKIVPVPWLDCCFEQSYRNSGPGFNSVSPENISFLWHCSLANILPAMFWLFNWNIHNTMIVLLYKYTIKYVVFDYLIWMIKKYFYDNK